MESLLKALFITHDYGIYGASQSLQLLLRNIKDTDVSIIIPRKEILTKSKLNEIANKFSVETRKIKIFFLPWDNCFECGKTYPFYLFLKMIQNFLWKLNKSWLYKEIQRGGYDYIYLNSLVLNRLINDKFPFILHIREIIHRVTKDRIDRIKRAKCVIFIDKASAMSLANFKIKKKIVLNNPFDMIEVKNYNIQQFEFENDVVISLIGTIVEGKGTDFIIKSFKKANCDKMCLLIVGKGNDFRYINYCKRIASEDDRIIFWGEEKNIFKIYAISDYIIRGEIEFRVGRTIFEALYSDCDVIVPSRRTDFIKNEEFINYVPKINEYIPRNIDSLSNILKSLANKKVTKKSYFSNVQLYVEKYCKYIREVLDTCN